MTPIWYGSIVKAPITPDGGVAKPRPAVVIMPPEASGRIVVVGTTTDNGRYDPANTARYDPALYIPMPHAADGSDPSGFLVPCAAKATWVQGFERENVGVVGTRLADQDLERLVQALRAWLRKHPPSIPG